MNGQPVKLHSWGVMNRTWDHFLIPQENSLMDCTIEGKTTTRILRHEFVYIVQTTPIVDMWEGVFHGHYGYYIQTMNNDVFELVGEPNKDFARITNITTKKLYEVVQAKKKWI